MGSLRKYVPNTRNLHLVANVQRVRLKYQKLESVFIQVHVLKSAREKDRCGYHRAYIRTARQFVESYTTNVTLLLFGRHLVAIVQRAQG